MMDQVNFEGRRPSLAQCIKAAKLSAKRGHTDIRFCWGENWCEVSHQSNGYWTGYGWLRTVAGDEIAAALKGITP